MIFDAARPGALDSTGGAPWRDEISRICGHVERERSFPEDRDAIDFLKRISIVPASLFPDYEDVAAERIGAVISEVDALTDEYVKSAPLAVRRGWEARVALVGEYNASLERLHSSNARVYRAVSLREFEVLKRRRAFHREGAYGGALNHGTRAQREECSLSFTFNPSHKYMMNEGVVRIELDSRDLPLAVLQATPYIRTNYKSLRYGQDLLLDELKQLEMRLRVAEPVPVPRSMKAYYPNEREMGARDLWRE